MYMLDININFLKYNSNIYYIINDSISLIRFIYLALKIYIYI